ncbi:hypothetical protein [Streptomyces sp. NBC_01497]|nr:hypothetical protein [Streptomyces sp. NBC_01497]
MAAASMDEDFDPQNNVILAAGRQPLVGRELEFAALDSLAADAQ